MQRIALSVLLLVCAIGSAQGLKCLKCEDAQGGKRDEACAKGNTKKMTNDTADPICVVFFKLDANKVVTEVKRSSHSTATPPNANKGCVEVEEKDKPIAYQVTCTCEGDSCNDYVLKGCNCEKPFPKDPPVTPASIPHEDHADHADHADHGNKKSGASAATGNAVLLIVVALLSTAALL